MAFASADDLGRVDQVGDRQHQPDWGDGTVTTTTDKGQGYPIGPEPNTHVYQEAGDATVTVTVVWDVTAGPPDQLQQLQLDTTGEQTVTATQHQAVRLY